MRHQSFELAIAVEFQHKLARDPRKVIGVVRHRGATQLLEYAKQRREPRPADLQAVATTPFDEELHIGLQAGLDIGLVPLQIGGELRDGRAGNHFSELANGWAQSDGFLGPLALI